MMANSRFAARRSFRSYVDVSRYTEMEVEHSHDTASQIHHLADGHIHPDTIKDFTKLVDQRLGEVKNEAL